MALAMTGGLTIPPSVLRTATSLYTRETFGRVTIPGKRPPLTSNVIQLRSRVIPSQCAHWRGNPPRKKEIATTSLRTGFAMTAN